MPLFHDRADVHHPGWEKEGRSVYSTVSELIKAHSTKLFRLLPIFFFVFLNFQLVYCQEKLLPVFHFYRLTTAVGLPTNEIRSNVVRDRLGFVWFGTANGLVRYDGYACKVYRPNAADLHSLSSTVITALHLDRHGNLWVGTFQAGISLYDPDKDNFINYLPRNNDTAWLQTNSIK